MAHDTVSRFDQLEDSEGGDGQGQGEIVIERPREEVFEFVANRENDPRYNSEMRVAKKLIEGLIGAGTSFSQETSSRHTG
jgi:hypothetical protein